MTALIKERITLITGGDRDLGTLTGLVNNAAVLKPQASVEQLDAARIASLFAVNVTGSFLDMAGGK
ncbi:hypothetical protein [Mixta intestinalis]|uniref:hypothetical protein n=1 Tax=Mixta intestinalis TaxID=1615494 RepID=UPI00136980CD